MTARESGAVERAVQRALHGESNTVAAQAEGCALSSVRRALRKRGEPPRPQPAGPNHHAYIDGRTAARRPG